MEFIIASNNQHKVKEICRILEPMGHSALSLKNLGIRSSPEESGLTFAENALIKAKEIAGLCGKAVIADDSGLCVDALDGAPGVYSARFAGEGHSDKANLQKLLDCMKRIPEEKRAARFVCAMALILPEGRTLEVSGSCEGVVGFVPKGENGFGYDPIFCIGGQSFAQLDAQQKDKISHRAVALQNLQKELPKFLEK